MSAPLDTLPMVSATAEAPSGILAYESDGLPEEYRGELLVTGWGDHVVQRFKLEPKGASFTAKPDACRLIRSMLVPAGVPSVVQSCVPIPSSPFARKSKRPPRKAPAPSPDFWA